MTIETLVRTDIICCIGRTENKKNRKTNTGSENFFHVYSLPKKLFSRNNYYCPTIEWFNQLLKTKNTPPVFKKISAAMILKDIFMLISCIRKIK
jgi:hypothetical protein